MLICSNMRKGVCKNYKSRFTQILDPPSLHKQIYTEFRAELYRALFSLLATISIGIGSICTNINIGIGVGKSCYIIQGVQKK